VLDWLWVVTAALSATPLLVNVAQPGGLTAWERLIATAVVAFAAWRPLEAALLLLGLGPFTRTAARLSGLHAFPLAWLLPSVLLGLSLAVVTRRISRARPPTAIVVAALVLSWLALASVVARVLADTVFFESIEAWRQSAWAFVGQSYFAGSSRWRTTTAGVWLAQEALLLPMVAWLVASSASRRALARTAVASATGVALLNVLGAIVVGLQLGTSPTIVQVFRTGRFSQAFPDVNAAGSLLALTVVVSGTLCASSVGQGRRRSAMLWAGVLVIQLAGLWLTGARVALASAALAGAALQLAAMWQKGFRTRELVGIAAVLVAGVVVLGASHVRRGNNDAPVAFKVRAEFVRTTWHMLRDHPVWGVGAGAYLGSSARYSSPALRAIYRQENAHNNFMQVAGELGLAALGAFAVLVLAPLACAGLALRHGQLDDTGRALWGGGLAFILTCAGGHPLLIPEVGVFAFTCLGGLASTCASDTRAGARRHRTSWILLAVAAGLIGSVPARVSAERRSTDLEHVVVTGQRWAKEDGVPTLRFRGEAAFYVVADGGSSRIALRVLDARRRPAEVTFRLDDEVANVLRLADSDWKSFSMRVPPRGRQRFRLLRVSVRGDNPNRRVPVVVLRRVDHLSTAPATAP
jgi:hypothetical protein